MAIFPLILTFALTALGQKVHASFETEIVGQEVFAYAGPAATYYPTSMLPTGTVVTVIGPSENGWLPIRPPLGSFSWIHADEVKENPDGSATVQQDDVRVRVGTKLSDAHHVHQVVLNKGDKVMLADEQVLSDKEGTRRWYKIIPPRGERRYVPLEAVRVLETGQRLEPSLPVTRSQSSSPANGSELLPIAARVGVSIIPAAEPIHRMSDAEPAEKLAESLPVVGPPIPIKDNPTKPLARRVESVAEQLTEMRTRLPRQWDLDSAEHVIEQLEKEAVSEADQAAVKSLRTVEQQMKTLYGRYEEVTRRRDLFLQQDRELAAMLRSAQVAVGQTRAGYDAVGVLRRSDVSIDGATTYSLVDAAGETTHYVNFPPGLSGEAYVGRRVGFMGNVSRRQHVPIPRLVVEQVALVE